MNSKAKAVVNAVAYQMNSGHKFTSEPCREAIRKGGATILHGNTEQMHFELVDGTACIVYELSLSGSRLQCREVSRGIVAAVQPAF